MIDLQKEIYIISGLGADERVLEKLSYGEYIPTYIHWIKPLVGEKLGGYIKRLSSQIRASNPIIVGLSFGGIVAVELSKLYPSSKLILLASAKTKYEIPYYLRMAAVLRLHKLLPSKIFSNSNKITEWLFGIKQKEEKKLLKNILEETDIDFMAWAIDQILSWKNTIVPFNFYHIHGDTDRILPLRFINCNYIIKNGGHFMTMNKYEEINQILRKVLTS